MLKNNDKSIAQKMHGTENTGDSDRDFPYHHTVHTGSVVDFFPPSSTTNAEACFEL